MRRASATILAILIAATGLWLAAPSAGAATSPAPLLVLDSPGLDFGPRAVGDDSPSQTVTLRNAGTAAIAGLTVGNPQDVSFTRVTTCTSALAVGATCTVNVVFTPATATSHHTTLPITYTGGGTSITLDGGGTAAESTSPILVSSTRLDFGYVPVGQSASFPVTLTNTSASSVTFTAAGGGVSAPFGGSTSCGGSNKVLGPGGSCTLTYSFTPTVVGDASDTSSIVVSVLGGASRTYPVSVSGSGGWGLRITPTRLDFGDVTVGTTSGFQPISITNTTADPITYTASITAFGSGFTTTTGCDGTKTLASGATCSFVARFAPGAAGAAFASATFAVTPEGGAKRSFTIELAGNGTAAGTTSSFPFRVTPTRLDFGDVPLGTNGAVQAVTITNTSATSRSIVVTTTGGTSELGSTNGCNGSPQVLAAGASCTLSFGFFPSKVASFTNTTTIKVAPVGTASRSFKVTSSGRGYFGFRVLPGGFDFGNVNVGSSGDTGILSIRNITRTSLAAYVSGGAATEPFSRATNCGGSPTTINAGSTCAMLYSFSPQGPGPFHTSTEVAIRPANTFTERSSLVTLDGYGRGNGPILWATPRSIDFGPIKTGTSAPSRTITVQNLGNQSSGLISLSGGGGGGQLNVTNGCSGLAAGATCNLTVTFNAGPTGTSTLTLDPTLSINGQVIPLHVQGTRVAPPSAIDDTRSASTNLTLSVAASSGVLANDSAFLGKATVSTGPTHGTLTLKPDGSYTYVPASGYSGGDSFTYVLTDAVGRTDTGAVALSVRSPNPSFVKAAYQDFLDRSATGSEVTSAATALDKGTKSRRAVLDGLATSPEWVGVIVDRFYQETLGRAGEPSGRDFWIRQISNRRRTVAQVAGEFYASSEYFNGFGGGTNATWVDDLFVKLLERQPTTSERATWIAQTVSKGRPSVAQRLFQSVESRKRRVTDLYAALLNRAPDAAGRDYWAGRILDEGDISLAIELGQSSEYLNKAQVRFP